MGLRSGRGGGIGEAPPGPGASYAVELRGVRRTYGRGDSAVHALRGVDMVLPQGSFTAVMGPSGSGKSTFLQCAAGLDKPNAGTVLLGGAEITGLSENRLTELRRSRVGFVFQSFNLLPSLTVLQNVLLPLRLAGRRPDRRLAAELLAQVGLESHARRRPGQLSGGQQQRVAIARALVTRPEVIFADEPTGALDTGTAHDVLRLLRHAVDGLGATVVLVTHDPMAASYADRVLFLADGELAGELYRPNPAAIADRLIALTSSTAPPHGAAPSSAAPSGIAPQGAAPYGSAPSGAASSGVAPQGSAPGGVAPRGVAPGGVAPQGAVPKGGASSGGALDGGAARGAVPNGGVR